MKCELIKGKGDAFIKNSGEEYHGKTTLSHFDKNISTLFLKLKGQNLSCK